MIAANEWDNASDAHQAVRADALSVSWGQLAPDDDSLNLVGDVAGRRVLDAGCGGGQNSVALALLGAQATGIDSSARQLEHARALAKSEGVEVDFLKYEIENFDPDALGRFDLVIAVQVMQYIKDAKGSLRALATLLASGGRLILSLDHPVRDLFFDAEEESFGVVPVANYHEMQTSSWRFAGSSARMTTYHRTVAEWVGLVAASGLSLVTLLETPVPADLLDELWPEDDALAPLRLIPHTLILVAAKP